MGGVVLLKQPQAVSNALALMSSVKLINYINSITNKSNNECINLTIFTSQKVAKLLVGGGQLAAFPMTRFVIYDLAGKQARSRQPELEPEAAPSPSPASPSPFK